MVAGQVLDMGREQSANSSRARSVNKTRGLPCSSFHRSRFDLEFLKQTLVVLRKSGYQAFGFSSAGCIWIWSLILKLWGRPPQKDLVAENVTYPAPVGIGRIKSLLTSELDACEDLLDQITAAYDFDPRAIKKLIEGLRI